MIVLFHDNFKITSVNSEAYELHHLIGVKLLKGIEQLSRIATDDTMLIWCHVDYTSHLNVEQIQKIDLAPNCIYSYNPNENDFFNRAMGYVDLSISMTLNYVKRYPTWLLSSKVGIAKIRLIKLALDYIPCNSDFDYFLKSFAKLAQTKGVFSYSEPTLLNGYIFKNNTFSKKDVFKVIRFTKQHFKLGWIIFLFYFFLIYEKKYTIIPSFFLLLYKRRSFEKTVFIHSLSISNTIDVSRENIDVLIPTIGRKKYLHDVLLDLKHQSLLPQKVIIIEQNPDDESTSDLDYLNQEQWPFEIVHVFTHQAGACNARNIGLKYISSDWVFLADDDIRIATNFIELALQKMIGIQCEAASFKCINNESILVKEQNPFQWGNFGSGSSIVKKTAIEGCAFEKGYEFGFGEDGDFGMQIRNKGIDVLFFSTPSLVHLKAPMGGFRNKPILDWANEPFLPKPSPTVMLYRLKHCTKEQNITYKLKLFLSFYRYQSIKNPLRYYKTFKKQWETSQKWATILLKKNEF